MELEAMSLFDLGPKLISIHQYIKTKRKIYLQKIIEDLDSEEKKSMEDTLRFYAKTYYPVEYKILRELLPFGREIAFG